MLMVAATVAYAIFGFAFAYVILLIGAVAAGYAQASANPSTNKLIAEALPAGRRGVVTGIKQSGVQAFIFLAAVSLPSLALAIGWRGALLVVALIPLAFIVITPRLIRPTSRDGAAAVVEHRGRLPAAIWWLTTYAFLMGFSGAVTFLVPLFASESLGFDPRVAGFVAGVIAIVGFAARIVWSRIAEFRSAYIGMLGVLGLVSVAASVAFWLSSQGAAWLVWVAAVLVGLGSSSWNGVGMLAVMANAGTAATGRASGFVLFGFMAGLGLAPPLFGRIVDATGGYDPIWVLSGISAFLSTVVAVGWKATSR